MYALHTYYCTLHARHAASLMDAKHPSATIHCAMAKRNATELGTCK
jgi:hypothetical protein